MSQELCQEYLVIIPKKDARPLYTFCDSPEAFQKMLASSANLSICNGAIIFDELSCPLEIQQGEVQDMDQRYFHLKTSFRGNDDQIKSYTALLRQLKRCLDEMGVFPETLRDDITLYYSKLAYEPIHKIESLMRKLITYFMFVNVGKQWHINSLPNAVKTAMEKSKRQEYRDVLHSLDFSQLSDLLFKAYPKEKEPSKLYKFLDGVQSSNDLDITKLKDFIPQSNWDKYFKDVVNCDANYIKSRWDKLYELRCRVAHNSSFGLNDLQTVERLASELEVVLEAAIHDSNRVTIPEEEKDELSEIIATDLNEHYGLFFDEFRKMATIINTLCGVNSGNNLNLVESSKDLKRQEIIEVDTFNQIATVVHVRDNLLRSPIPFEYSELQEEIRRVKLVIESLLDKLGDDWLSEITKAFVALGGSDLKLPQIYDHIEANTEKTLSKSWKAIVRRTIYSNSSSSRAFSTGNDLFVLSEGLWSYRNMAED